MAAPKIADQVFLGFCDVQAAGLRALASLVLGGANGSHQITSALELGGLSHDLPPVFSSNDSCPLNLPAGGSSRASICTYFDGSNNALASTILINAAVPLGSQAQVIASLLQLLQASGGGSSSEPANRCLHIIAAVHTGGMRVKSDGLYGLSVNGAVGCLASSSLAVEQLPSGMRVKDPFLATLLDLGTASGLPMNLLSVSGFKPSLAAEAQEDFTAASVLGQAVASCVLGVQYEAGVCSRLQLQHRWYDARQTGFEAMYV